MGKKPTNVWEIHQLMIEGLENYDDDSKVLK